MYRNSCIVMTLLMSLVGIAQQSTVQEKRYDRYSDALTLYQQNSFLSARHLFDELIQSSPKDHLKTQMEYNRILTSYKLQLESLSAEIKRFRTTYPKNVYEHQLIFLEATHFFELSNFEKALELYAQIDVKSIAKENQAQYYFNYAYSLFLNNDLKKATSLFENARTDNTYESKARFYLAYIAYRNNDLGLAKSLFSIPFSEEALTIKTAYFMADISFREADYTKAIEAALNYLPDASSSEKALLNKIIAASYFQIKAYSKAIPYYEAYKSLAQDWSTLDSYQLGYCYFEHQDYELARSIFSTIINGNDEIAQNAYYQLGACYMKLNKKSEALTAFRASYQLGFSTSLNEVAQYQYAKLSYDVGNPFEAAVAALGRFITNFPRSTYVTEIKSLLVEAYVQTNDFEAALSMIEAQPQLASKKVLQQVTFLKAMDLIRLRAYDAALDYLDRSYESSKNTSLAARSLFWKAESLLELNKDQLALQQLIELQKHPKRSSIEEVYEIDFLRAYAYFKMKRFYDAIPSFKKYVTNGSVGSSTYTDALVKLADCYYVTKDFKVAINAYNTVLRYPSEERAYAAFKIAMAYGYLQQNTKKISLLKKWLMEYTNSSLRDEASYNLAMTYASEGENELAIATYDKLVLQHPQSPLVAVSKLKKGLLLYSQAKSTEALELFVGLTKDFPRTEEAIQAVAAAKRIYMEQADLETYTQWIQNLDYISESEESLDKSSFDAAKQLSTTLDVTKAIKAYEYYIETYPKGRYQLESRFNLAKLYLKTDLKNKALPLFTSVAQQPSMFKEEALLEKISLLMELNGLDSALGDLKELELTANRIQNEHFAISNLMRIYYMRNELVLAKSYAKKLLAVDGLEQRLESDALLILARTSFKLGALKESKSAYAIISDNSSSEIAAEALYFTALFLTKEAAYEQSNERIQVLAKQYPAYKKWAAKGLVLMATNFIGLNDSFQAHYILSSVIKNFTQFPETVAEATALLATISNEETSPSTPIANDSIQ